MKTFTEFDGFLVTKWLPVYTQLNTEGKTPEEVTASMGEQTKYEGEKLNAFLQALGAVKDKAERLKRIVAMTPASETETPSDKLLKTENYYFGVEYYPEMKKAAPAPRKDDRNDRGGRGGDRNKGRGGRDGKPGGPGRGGERGGPRPEGGAPSDRAAGDRRPSRGRRPEGGAEAGAGGGAPGAGGRPPRRDGDRPRKRFDGDKRGGPRGPKKEFDPNAPGRLIAVGLPPEFRKKETPPAPKVAEASNKDTTTSES
jgi:hypothetical protein